MNPNERIPLILGHLFILLAGIGILGIFITGASTGAVVLFVAGLAGVVVATVALVEAEQCGQRPAGRSG